MLRFAVASALFVFVCVRTSVCYNEVCLFRYGCIHCTHAFKVFGFWFSSHCLFFYLEIVRWTTRKIEVAIVESYLWCRRQKTLLKRTHNVRCAACFTMVLL